MSDLRTINQRGLDLIKHFEGWRNQAYQDVAGHWTIGYGHLIRPSELDSYISQSTFRVITQEEGEALLRQDVAEAEAGVVDTVQVDLTDDQFAALVSFGYNLGIGSEQRPGALRRSTLLKLLNRGNTKHAGDEFAKWVYANHRVWDGLVLRRHAEKALFFSEHSFMNAIIQGDREFVEHYLEGRPTYFRRDQLLSALEN